MLIKDADENYKTINVKDAKKSDVDLLELVFENGVLLRDMSFDEVRANAM